MASCSFVATGRTFTLEVVETSYSIANNTSDVKWTLTISGGGSTWYNTYAKATVNGSVVYNETKNWQTGSFPAKDGSTSGYIYGIGHDSQGNKSISFALEGYSEVYTTQYSSGSLTLTKINRYPILNYGSNFTDEGNPTYNITSYNTYPIRIKLEAGGNAQLITRDVSASTSGNYTLVLTESERNTLRALCPNSNTLSVIETVCAMNGNTELSASYKSYTMSIVNANPTFEYFDYNDINETTLALTGNSKTIVNNYSNVEVEIIPENKAIANKGSSMNNYIFNTNKASYSSTETVSILSNNYNLNTIIVQAVDSRGNSKPVEKRIDNYIEYSDLIKKNISVSRSDNGVGKFVTLKYNGTWWNDSFGLVENTLTVSYKYKKTTSNEYIEGTTNIDPTINDDTFSFSGLIIGDTEDNGFEISDSYDLVVVVSDELSSVEFSIIIGAGSPAIAICGNKASLGNKYDRYLGGTQLWGDVYLNGSIIGDYSTNEIIVGRWINKKPLYRKVISTTTTVSNDTTINHYIDNVDLIYIAKAFAINNNNGITWTVPTDLYGTGGTTNVDRMNTYVNKNEIGFKCDTTWGTYWTKVIVLEYTKTTD